MNQSANEQRTNAAGPATERQYGVSYRNIVISVLLSLVVVVVIGFVTWEPQALRLMWDSFHPWFLGLALATVIARIIVGGWRLQYVSSGHLTFSEAIRGQLSWDFFSIVTPSVIGGGPIAAVYLSRVSTVRVGEATALLFFAMLLDQFFFAATVPLLIIATFFLPVFPPAIGTVGTTTFLLYFVGLMGWVSLFAYITFFRPQVLEKWTAKIFRIRWLRKYEDRVAKEMTSLQERARLIRSQPPGFFVKGSVLTLVAWSTRYLLVIFIIWSVHENLDVLLALIRTGAMTLASLILPTPGGSGGVEGLYALFLGPPIMPKFLVAPTLLVWRVLGYYVYIGIGGYLTMHRVREEIRARRIAAVTVDTTPSGS